MKIFIDFLPIFIFFIAYKIAGIYAATLAAVAISICQLASMWFLKKKLEELQIITLVVISLLGGATLFLHEEIFIKWKPTVINWLFALAFALSTLIGKKNFTRRLLEPNIDLPNHVWSRLNISWILFFLSLGALNLFVIYHCSTNDWVNFKLFGMLGLTIVFVIAQGFYIARYAKSA